MHFPESLLFVFPRVKRKSTFEILKKNKTNKTLFCEQLFEARYQRTSRNHYLLSHPHCARTQTRNIVYPHTKASSPRPHSPRKVYHHHNNQAAVNTPLRPCNKRSAALASLAAATRSSEYSGFITAWLLSTEAKAVSVRAAMRRAWDRMTGGKKSRAVMRGGATCARTAVFQASVRSRYLCRSSGSDAFYDKGSTFTPIMFSE